MEKISGTQIMEVPLLRLSEVGKRGRKKQRVEAIGRIGEERGSGVVGAMDEGGSENDRGKSYKK